MQLQLISRRLSTVLRNKPAIPRCLFSSQTVLHQEDDSWGTIQKYRISNIQRNETDDVKRARLIYQSRKRGNLENGILLSTFADKYLDQLNSEQLSAYDQLINLPDNDWDIYYWVTEAKIAPNLFQTDVLRLLQEHSRNKAGEFRNQQPALKPRL